MSYICSTPIYTSILLNIYRVKYEESQLFLIEVRRLVSAFQSQTLNRSNTQFQ